MIRLAFLGDIHLASALDIDSDLLRTLDTADLVVGNLESAITNSAPTLDKPIELRSRVGAENYLASWKVNLVSVANNHVFDCGWDGYSETTRRLESAGIKYLGAGTNLEEARQPLVLEIRGTRVAFLAATSVEIDARIATAGSYGCAPIDDLFDRQIANLAAAVDAVVVLVHWGFTNYTLPAPESVALARKWVASGASLVVGTHAHVVQGVECLDSSLIAYNLGDFAFSEESGTGSSLVRDAEGTYGGVLEVVVEGGSVVSSVFHPTVESHGVVRSDQSPVREKVVQKRSAYLERDSHAYLAAWRSYSRRRVLRRARVWIASGALRRAGLRSSLRALRLALWQSSRRS